MKQINIQKIRLIIFIILAAIYIQLAFLTSYFLRYIVDTQYSVYGNSLAKALIQTGHIYPDLLLLMGFIPFYLLSLITAKLLRIEKPLLLSTGFLLFWLAFILVGTLVPIK